MSIRATEQEENLGAFLTRNIKKMTDAQMRSKRERVKDWIRETVMLMVDHADEVKVIEGSVSDEGTQLTIVIHADDTGKVIGKQGRNVRSLRITLMAISRAIGHNFALDVADGREEQRAEQQAHKQEAQQ